jgi:magnesium chelatase family protein
MGIATARTLSLQGAVGHLVDVQVDVSQGMVTTTMVGRPDTAITEARDRCRAALVNSGFDWPVTRRLTILLSPADLPKRGPHFDLAIAVAVLSAAGGLDPAALSGSVFIGELTLDGRVRAVPGVLPMVLAASRRGLRRAFVPEPHLAEATLVPDVDVVGVRSLAQVVAFLAGQEVPEAPPVEPLGSSPLLSWRGSDRSVDMSEVQGMADARFALEIAAAGGHHILLSGPKGSGKTTLAERVPTMLPDLDVEESLELTSVLSLAGALPADVALVRRPPFRAPHHSASRAAVLGGGSGRVHPGELSRALHGVLFLDEFPLFRTDLIDALRQPLESGEVTIARGDETATFPARSLVVLAANPCPCGNYHPLRRDHACVCSEVARRGYRARISGPIADRIDITRHIEPVRPYEMSDPLARPESSAEIRSRVESARSRQAERYADVGWRLNGEAPGPVLTDRFPLEGKGATLLDTALYSGRITRRGAVRVHRVAWTLADLAGSPTPSVEDVEVALRLRLGEPLPDSALRRAVTGPVA